VGKEHLPSFQPPIKQASSIPHPSGVCSYPATPVPQKQYGAAYGWTTVSTFVSVRTLGFVRLLLSIPLVQLRAATHAVLASLPLRASGIDNASLRPIRRYETNVFF
jgi:hypothetical protein